LGPNGSGKTTLAKHLNGLLKPTQGRVLVELRDTRSTRIAELARLVGYAFQNPDHQIFAPTVQDEVAFGPRTQELPLPIVTQRVAEALDRFRLDSCADLPPALLGFGQRRQVALAATIAGQPKILILDEPTGGLDWRSQQEFIEIIASFNALGRTVVLITHDMRLVAEYATRTIVLLDGERLFDGTPRQLFARTEILERAGLELPPVARLARRLAEYGMPSDTLTPAEFAAAWQSQVHACKPRQRKARRAGSAAEADGGR
jgi:energy-coupling factor transport system ATP-binding protein